MSDHTGNLAEILVTSAAVIIGMPIPLVPIQILLMNPLTDALPDLPPYAEGAHDLLREVELNVRRRKWGVPVRLEIERGFDGRTLDFLRKALRLESDAAVIDGPLDLTFLMSFAGALKGYDHLKYPKHQPVLSARIRRDG